MKKKTIRKQLLAWVLAGAMMPQSSIAYAAETAASVLAPKEDILVRWLPEKDQIKAGDRDPFRARRSQGSPAGGV